MAVLPETVDIVTRDMQASLMFYRMLGLAIPVGADSETMVEYRAENGFTITWSLEQLFVSAGGEKWASLPGRGRVRLAFRCDASEEVDSVYARRTEAGYTGEQAPWDAFWGQRFAQVLDPDGCLIDIAADLQRP